jgi:electron transfer flavoprotein beta subunit
MKILVCAKQVPARDSNLRVDTSGKWLDEADLTYEINEPDAYALEEALQLREKVGGEVIVLSSGPERVTQTIREALAKGADRAIHIRIQEPSTLDPFASAKLLAQAVRTESPDLVLTGLQSDDLGYGETGVILAELLGSSHATIVMEVMPEENRVKVKRELEDGWFQNVELPLPAVLAIQSGIKKLRYATLMGIKKAKSKEIKAIDGESLEAGEPGSASIERVYPPPRTKQMQLMTGDARQMAAQLVEKLKFEARVL